MLCLVSATRASPFQSLERWPSDIVGENHTQSDLSIPSGAEKKALALESSMHDHTEAQHHKFVHFW